MSNLTRRQFIEDTILAAAAAGTASIPLQVGAAEMRPVSANDKITVAILGCGIRGKQHANELARLPDCEIAYVCDPDIERATELAAEVGKKARRPKAVQDLRVVLEDKSVAAVFVATLNHWHALAAIWAMQAGKDVYVEKPVCHNVSEGRRMVQVARKLGRVCQAGTQNRASIGMAETISYLHAGKLGEVKLARSIVHGNRASIGGPGRYDIPSNVDYNLFAGPAPMSPLTRPKFHYDWHWFWETGNGELGNNNIHAVDICRWGLGVSGPGRAVLSYGGRFGYTDAGQTPNTQVVIHDFGGKTIVQETRGLKSEPYNPAFKSRWSFFGTEGIIAGTSLFDPAGKLIKTFEGPVENHFANFLRVVRSRKTAELRADVLEGHRSTGLCHIGNISYRLGRPASLADVEHQLGQLNVHDDVAETLDRTRKHLVENGVDLKKTPLTLGPLLRMDGDKESFIGNPKADALLTREYRAPFVVPSAKDIGSA